MPSWSLRIHKMPASNKQGCISYIQWERQTLASCCSLLRERKNCHRSLWHTSCISLDRTGPHIHSCTKHSQGGGITFKLVPLTLESGASSPTMHCCCSIRRGEIMHWGEAPAPSLKHPTSWLPWDTLLVCFLAV